MSEPTVSVAMATYNGAAFVAEQMQSILEQLSSGDEVVVVDDASGDDTVQILRALGDPRVRVVELPVNGGYVSAFERAMSECRGDVVLLADQDDVWIPGRRDLLVAALEEADVVASNVVLLDGDRPLRGPYGQAVWRLRQEDGPRRVRNVVQILAGNRPYYGCAMGLRREALAGALPFPDYLNESHDLWLAMYANVRGSLVHVPEPTLWRRVHDSNTTPSSPRGVVPALRSRWMLLRALVTLVARARTSG